MIRKPTVGSIVLNEGLCLRYENDGTARIMTQNGKTVALIFPRSK